MDIPGVTRGTVATADRLRLTHLQGGQAAYRPGEVFGPRTLGDFEFVWIVAGQVSYEFNGQRLAAPPGTLILGRPGFHETYHWDPQQTSRHLYYHFGVATMPKDWPELDHWPVVRPVEAGSGEAIKALFRQVLDQWEGQGARRDVVPSRGLTRLVEAMIELFLHPSAEPEALPAGARPEPVVRALAWLGQRLDQHPDLVLRLGDMAKAAAISPKHLCRLFQRHLQVRPMEAVRLMRMERALMLLTRSNLSIKEIAARCGFISPYHFSRSFSKVYGLPPTVVRQQTNQGAPPPDSPLPFAFRSNS